MDPTYARAMRPIILLLAIPLIVISALQVMGIPRPVVIFDLVAAVIVAAVAGVLSRALSEAGPDRGLSRAEWAVLGAGWAAMGVAIVAALTTALGWAMSTTWAAVMLAGVLMARAERPSVTAAAVFTGLLSVATPLGRSTEELLSSAAVFLSLVVPVLAVGLVVRNQRRSAVVQREAARDRERRAMAEELHDVIAHEVTGIIVLAQAVRPGVAGTPTAAAIERIEASGQRALDQIRSMIATGRTARNGAEPAYAPTVASLSELRPLVENFEATVGADVRFTLRGEEREVSPQVAMAASRILTEALTNVRRHALTATQVEVVVAADEQNVRVEVRDNGFGGGVGAGNGTGVAGIRERAALLGGSARVGRGPDGRWAVEASIPLATTDAAGVHEGVPARSGGAT